MGLTFKKNSQIPPNSRTCKHLESPLTRTSFGYQTLGKSANLSPFSFFICKTTPRWALPTSPGWLGEPNDTVHVSKSLKTHRNYSCNFPLSEQMGMEGGFDSLELWVLPEASSRLRGKQDRVFIEENVLTAKIIRREDPLLKGFRTQLDARPSPHVWKARTQIR